MTDGIKRALRNFGNLLGNCLYDKEYAKEIVKIKVPPVRLSLIRYRYSLLNIGTVFSRSLTRVSFIVVRSSQNQGRRIPLRALQHPRTHLTHPQNRTHLRTLPPARRPRVSSRPSPGHQLARCGRLRPHPRIHVPWVEDNPTRTVPLQPIDPQRLLHLGAKGQCTLLLLRACSLVRLKEARHKTRNYLPPMPIQMPPEPLPILSSTLPNAFYQLPRHHLNPRQFQHPRQHRPTHSLRR